MGKCNSVPQVDSNHGAEAESSDSDEDIPCLAPSMACCTPASVPENQKKWRAVAPISLK